MMTETRGYSVQVARLRINRPAKCAKCGRFVGKPNMAGRIGRREFVCRDCSPGIGEF